MHVVRQNVEKNLFSVLKKHWHDQTGYRCAHIKTGLFPADEDDKQSLIATMIERARQDFDDPLGMIFKCHDGDIFIVARFMTFRQVDTFIDKIIKSRKDLDGPQRVFLKEKATFLYEVSVEWPKIKTICEYKIQSYLNMKDEASRENAAQEYALNQERILRMDLDESLTSTLARRRQDREKVSVLVVEDDLFTQKLVANAISADGEVSMAQDGFAAILMYVQKAPDIMFLDIGLPDVSGHSVLDKILSIDPKAYVVMLSGHGDRDNVMKAMDHGARGFVGKPFTKDKLVQYIGKSSFVQEKRQKQGREHAHLIE